MGVGALASKALKLEQATIHFLRILVTQGADLYQLFDSWAGALDHAEYLRWAQPQHRAIFAGAGGVPRILFVKDGPYLDLFARQTRPGWTYWGNEVGKFDKPCDPVVDPQPYDGKERAE